MYVSPNNDKSSLGSEGLQKLVSGFPGGYWQHEIIDHVLLINPYFPPCDLVGELQRVLPKLLGHYPSVAGETEENVGRLIGQPSDRIVVGNGVIEIISSLLKQTDMSLAVPTPSFNAYEDYPSPQRVARFALQPPNFELDVDAYAAFVQQAGVDAAVIINPHNPTSTLVHREDVLRLAEVLGKARKLLLVDESFIEFAALGRAESVEAAINEHKNLVVLKSLGKIYGACGLRIGYLLSSDTLLVNRLRQSLPTWNLNVLAEYLLGRLPDFGVSAADSWERVKSDRNFLFEDLQSFPEIHVLRPNANFVFLRLPKRWPDGQEIAERMLRRHKILVRHCRSKTMENGERYLRIAAKTQLDNEHLITCLHEVADEL